MILLDTDILIDVALDREGFAEPAVELLDRVECGISNASIAWHTISNFYYLVVPIRGRSESRDFISELLGFVSVAPTDTESARFAISLQMADFEDALQVAAARAANASLIVSKNVKDYARSPIRAVDATEALEILA